MWKRKTVREGKRREGEGTFQFGGGFRERGHNWWIGHLTNPAIMRKRFE